MTARVPSFLRQHPLEAVLAAGLLALLLAAGSEVPKANTVQNQVLPPCPAGGCTPAHNAS
ncbi:MAG: hypothetical protein JO348_12735 [Alphaproteobacteria bacterium]|nr:hypothetical protein [Alphaproteobacteria bacterium]MBV9420630.1 hypothetical protein [Alphaproteobacteria bacterium]